MTHTSCPQLSPAERSALAEKWQYLPLRVLNDLLRRWPSLRNLVDLAGHDDVVQAGQVGLIRAARVYDPNRGVQFITLAYKATLHAIQRELHYRRRLGAPKEFPEGLEPSAPDSHPEIHDDVTAAVNTLEPADRQVLSWRFGLGGGPECTLAEIANRLGCCYETARQRVNQALERTAVALGRLR